MYRKKPVIPKKYVPRYLKKNYKKKIEQEEEKRLCPWLRGPSDPNVSEAAIAIVVEVNCPDITRKVEIKTMRTGERVFELLFLASKGLNLLKIVYT